jgi:Protein of unknown function (DUF1552)
MSSPALVNQRFSRRSLLRGLGAGSVLLAPFVRNHAAMAQGAPAGNLLIFYTPNGHKRSTVVNDPIVQSIPCFDAAKMVTGMTLGRSLMPLQPFQNDIAVIKGLNLKTPTFISSHQDICRILTCWGAPVESNSDSQFTAFGPSIDQSIGSALNQRPVVVAVDPYRDTPHWRTALSWSASGVSVPFVKNHQAVFTDLFGGLTGAKPDVATVRRRVNISDRFQLESYLDSVHSLEKRVTRASTPACAANALQTRITALPPKATVQVDDKSVPGVAAEMQAHGELWMDMIAAAFACGTRRVGVIQWQGASEGYDPAGNEGSPTHHSITQNGVTASGDRWIAIDTWYANRFAYQLAALKALGILDRTIVAWVSEITEGHNQLNMVTVVAGGQALGMKMGQYIQYPFTGPEVEGMPAIAVAQNPANKSLADLWVTIQQAMGVNKSTFGDPKWSTGPLTELRG